MWTVTHQVPQLTTLSQKAVVSRVLRCKVLLWLINSQGLSPWQNNRRGKQGGETRGGRGWRSKLIPHVPREETFQEAWACSAGGRAQKHTANSESTSVHFPALFAHTLLCAESTWIHLAQLRHHKAQFTFFGSTKLLLQRNQRHFK